MTWNRFIWCVKKKKVVLNQGLSVLSHISLCWCVGPVGYHQLKKAGEHNVYMTAQSTAGSAHISTFLHVLSRIHHKYEDMAVCSQLSMQSAFSSCHFFFYLSPLHLAVRIYTQKQVYATDTDITLLAVTEEPGPLEFLWDFGDRRPVRTTSKAITQKFHNPKRLLLSTYSIFCNSMSIILDNWIVSFCIIRYDVTVRALCSKASTVSDVYTVIVQREVKPNKLQFQSSVLINTAVDFKCRISAGTDVTYLWSFGDGTTRLGQTTEQHVFDRWVLALTI